MKASKITFSCGKPQGDKHRKKKQDCCVDINAAIRTYNDSLVVPIKEGLMEANTNYDGDELNTRVLAAIGGISKAGMDLRKYLRKLNRLDDKCSKCCAEAAAAMADAASSYAQYIILVGSEKGIPTDGDPPANLQSVIDGLLLQLSATLELAYDTTRKTCNPCPCPPEPQTYSRHHDDDGCCKKKKKVPCCVAINTAISLYTTGLVDPIKEGLAAAAAEFQNPANLAARILSAFGALVLVGQSFRQALRDLLLIKDDCECCEEAAITIAHASLDYAQYIITIASMRGVQTDNLTEPQGGVFGQLIVQLDDTLALIRETIKCPDCPPPIVPEPPQ